jgi:hypothetical protein
MTGGQKDLQNQNQSMIKRSIGAALCGNGEGAEGR